MNITFICLCLFTNMASVNAASQREQPQARNRVLTRDIKLPKASELVIKLYKGSDTDRLSIDASKEIFFKSGELITVYYIVNTDAYIYFINITKKGAFIINRDMGTKVLADQPHNLEFEVHGDLGREELVILLSPKPIAKLEAALKTTSKAVFNFTTPKASQGNFNALLKKGRMAALRIAYDHIE